MAKVDPRSLMYWVKDYKNANPGEVEVDGKIHKLILIAVQRTRRILRKGEIKNWIYRVGDTRLIVYKEYPKSPAVMKMGISGHTWELHSKAVQMEVYADYFLGSEGETVPADRDKWLGRNDFELV